nr:phosphoribosylglycinamide formyltransferase [Brevibacterium daeguense]
MASGSGTLTQSVLDAFVLSGDGRGVEIAAVGSDRPDAGVLERARSAGVETFVVSPQDFADRDEWNHALTEQVAEYDPDWVVSAGFMRILGSEFVDRFALRIINTHPALLPSFPGAHGVRDALAHGVKVTGTTIHLVDSGVDTGPVIAQFPVAIEDDDTEDTLHERIREIERRRIVELLEHLALHSLTVDGRRVSGFTPARD